MKEQKVNDTKKEGYLQKSANRSYEQIFLDILVFSACAGALIFNLFREGVGLWALTAGTASERNLLLLTAAMEILCLVSIVVQIKAFALKKDMMKEKNMRGLKTTNTRRRK
ncbi:MAG: hypothetical protein LUC95_11170 [Lachnospiraceae bacterium]|nr:hypothetical protein [Lachnospiraceae bacterium]